MPKFIIILGSLDTKGIEVDFLRHRVRAEGGIPLIIDTGVLGEASVPADITRDQVAEAGGSTIQDLIDQNDKTHALLVMAQGASIILNDYLQNDEIGGVLSIGGSRGTALSTKVMQTLPIGVPKVMVSTIASGQNTFGPYVGTKDITLMHSIADVQGINAVTRPIFTNAVAAIVGMSRVGAPIQRHDKQLLTASMLGVSTTLVGQIQSLMDPEHYEVVAFHAIGTGGRAMEELITSGLVEGVFDVTPGEIVQDIVNEFCSAGPNRMLAAAQKGIPQVVAPGGVDFIITGPIDQLSQEYQKRKIMSHTPTITLVRTSVEEITTAAKLIAKRLSESNGPVLMILPTQAFGWFAMEGRPLHDPESDQAFIQAFKENASPKIEIIEMNTHLNDPKVGKVAASWMKKMLSSRGFMN